MQKSLHSSNQHMTKILIFWAIWWCIWKSYYWKSYLFNQKYQFSHFLSKLEDFQAQIHVPDWILDLNGAFFQSKTLIFDYIWLSKESNLDCSDARNSASAILGAYQKKRLSGGMSVFFAQSRNSVSVFSTRGSESTRTLWKIPCATWRSVSRQFDT